MNEFPLGKTTLRYFSPNDRNRQKRHPIRRGPGGTPSWAPCSTSGPQVMQPPPPNTALGPLSDVSVSQSVVVTHGSVRIPPVTFSSGDEV